ncbi:hypothetical protein BC628DRAFT_493810 [Trametes gibbosa]|nr:hypothetical protein BC628DRAFT_493810 [Trametes gibbosa]
MRHRPTCGKLSPAARTLRDLRGLIRNSYVPFPVCASQPSTERRPTRSIARCPRRLASRRLNGRSSLAATEGIRWLAPTLSRYERPSRRWRARTGERTFGVGLLSGERGALAILPRPRRRAVRTRQAGQACVTVRSVSEGRPRTRTPFTVA